MLADDLKNVLEELYRAGAHRVPAEDIDWPQDLHAAVFRALNMQYMVRRQDGAGHVEFSLTRAGYTAIDAEVPWSQILRTRLRDSCRSESLADTLKCKAARRSFDPEPFFILGRIRRP
ncbi:hypothetical protein ACIQUG_32890 [Ensifer sp. NPDC090286]|uniref:hypothetical protein n=1 Tax=Ensifer sp. NPDC090286 TaxID=3363991 RepID=UPI00383BC44A